MPCNKSHDLHVHVHATHGPGAPGAPALLYSSSSFTSFGFSWPPLLSKMYNVASMSSFNEQFLAPECSIGVWGFKLKYGRSALTPLPRTCSLPVSATVCPGSKW